MSSDEEWIPYYHQQQQSNISSAGLSQETTTTSPEKITSSPTSCNKGGSGNCISKKPIRRRSRASKKTPTTRLNATATNFRALVQKFTGCTAAAATTTTTILSFGSQRGPLNLSFAGSKNDATNIPAMATHGSGSGSGGGGCYSSSFGYDSNCNYFQMTATPDHQGPPNHPQMMMLDQDHHHHQQQQSLFSMFDQDRPSDLSAYNCGNSTPSIHTLDDFLGQENISLYELIGDA